MTPQAGQNGSKPTIIYTVTDEAPALATYALLPIITKFARSAGISVDTCDISVAARVLAQFPELLLLTQKQKDTLAELGELVKEPHANIIKLPNVSASIPQLVECIKELQSKDYAIPDYPFHPQTPLEHDYALRYAKVLGSAVNPVLREGNSDRRVAAPVKAYAQQNPHKMSAWSSGSKTHVAHMADGDFYSSEQSAVMATEADIQIDLVSESGEVTCLKESTKLEAMETIDAAVLNVKALREYFEKEISSAQEEQILLSLHLKATMMKISDPIIFGHCVTVFFKDAFTKHAAALAQCKANPNNGLGSVLESVDTLPEAQAAAIRADFEACYEGRPWLAMVNSSKGITNLHVPSDVIVDASMPVVIRDGGMMWNKEDSLESTKCLIPDRCYATMYQEVVEFCKEHGQFNVSTMGNISNVGLMAKKAEEYGSHDKTFELASSGTVRATNKTTGEVVFEHKVEKGDLYRMCQTKDEPIKDWVKLAVRRAAATGNQTIFWLDAARAHDANLIEKVNLYLKNHDTTGCDISIMAPVAAIRQSMNNAKDGKDTISVTGNVLRDYLTDLFPILELGTSAKMLSIVPLLNGGGMFETGAGGSAPKHVQQYVKEGHLRWDSLGEYLALAVSFEHLAETTNNQKAKLLGDTLNEAISHLLNSRRSPSRKVNEPDNRASSFYLSMYWAKAMGKHDPKFEALHNTLEANRAQIIREHMNCQGTNVDIGGYYQPDPAKTERSMRPSATLNAIMEAE